MPSNLLIVESPSKAKTLKKYLGKDFEVLASYGHVRDLVPKQGAVDTEHGFAMKYQLIERNSKHVDSIAKAVKEASHIYLATDPDREGEAIAWHIAEILKARKGLAGKSVSRVVFHEITQGAVQAAVASPRSIAMPLVNAQQARRALDYLVGFNLSPLLWRKIRRGLSAGRVQSPALRLIVERELEIEAFKAQEYWTVHLDSHKGRQKFTGKLFQYRGRKLDQFDIASEAAQAEAVAHLVSEAQGAARVAKLEKKKKQRHAAAPFTTSTLQQEAVRKLGFSTDRTMRVAQQLYEGIDTGSGLVGLITYMRTDSVNLAQEAVAELREYIAAQFSPDYLPKEPLTYRSSAKNAQEAHEAIRPTSIARTPDAVRAALTGDQAKLYEMIWKRTLASQMSSARYDTVSVDLEIGADSLFRASGQTLTFPGFIAVYQEGADEAQEEGESRLPPFELDERVPVDALRGEQHFTQPPPRYTEASLVKTLEEYGIGRPSTYASIISTLLDREYVVLEKKRFQPTDVGRVVNKFLTEHFTRYVDYDFTAKLEDSLDQISTGKREWVPVLESFWGGFKALVDEKQGLSRKEVTQELLEEACPKCGQPLTTRLGKRGKFVGCSAYPACDYTRSLAEEGPAPAPEVVEGRTCPQCGSPLVIKTGPYGRFIGCSGYPKCKYIEPLEKPKDTQVKCPECGKGTLIERKSRYGKLFYSCSTYPACKYAVWNPPIAEPCPRCGSPILTLKTTKRRGTEKVCPNKECGYSEPVPAADESS
ncbi:MAG: type I DNA topoisomerase [Betaproteobacteria bacterium]|nr:type I DNA topoisomerase [Betaproteobacteria bacterium]